MLLTGLGRKYISAFPQQTPLGDLFAFHPYYYQYVQQFKNLRGVKPFGHFSTLQHIQSFLVMFRTEGTALVLHAADVGLTLVLYTVP